MAEELIQFPKNYERYLQLAQEALNRGTYEEAMLYFEDAYEITPEFPLNYMMVDTAVKMGDFQRAQDLVEDHLQDYQCDSEFLVLYIQVLIGNKMFLKAYEMIRSKLFKANEYEALYWEQIKKMLELAEGHYRKEHAQQIEKVKTEALEMKQESLLQQLLFAQKLEQLPHTEYIIFGKDLLANSDTHAIVKASILETFQRLRLEEKVIFLSFANQQFEIIPCQILQIREGHVYQGVLRFLEDKLLHNDPIAFHNVLTELQLHVALLYPFIEERIQFPQLLGTAYLLEYDAAQYLKTEIPDTEMAQVTEYCNLIQELQNWLHQHS